MSARDAPFILGLMNDPSWLRFIGDKGVRTLEDARGYIRRGPEEMYARLGFGLLLVALRAGDISVGICGLIKREALEDVDLGFAFLPEYRGNGYAFESASAVISHSREALALRRIVAITSPDNLDSIRLLKRLGFRFERSTLLPGNPAEVHLYASEV